MKGLRWIYEFQQRHKFRSLDPFEDDGLLIQRLVSKFNLCEFAVYGAILVCLHLFAEHLPEDRRVLREYVLRKSEQCIFNLQ